MQVDPIRPTLKAPGSKRLKRKCDEAPSHCAFKLNLRRYIKAIYLELKLPNAEVATKLAALRGGGSADGGGGGAGGADSSVGAVLAAVEEELLLLKVGRCRLT